MDNMLDTVMQQVNSTNVSDQTGNNANGVQSNGSNVDNISEESRANNDNTETPIGAKKPMHNKSKQVNILSLIEFSIVRNHAENGFPYCFQNIPTLFLKK
ncbi:hypothetical protein DdX_02684 [Ditylenchus destructor]|uniref:Uncharacterized protein n=1 Tax=Ditylenchus destructor TaxID=166010 RepID=A0AAD4NI20_9BILA|nr:hypothetical protein DdX_02684 [Ditylenchus destructor]